MASWMLLMCALTLGLWGSLSSADSACSNEYFSVNPEDQMGSEGEMVTFNCVYSGSDFFVWEFFPVTGRRRTVGNSDTIPHFEINPSNGALTITSLESNHSGYYACRATPSSGCNVFSENASLIVRGTPTISVTANSFTANATERVEIPGLVQGYPLATVQLHKDDGSSEPPQVNDPRVNITQPSDENPNYKIVFSDLTTSDEGNYIVKAVNTEGDRSENVRLSVTGPDRPNPSVTTPYIIENFPTDIRVTCSVDARAGGSNAELSMQWTNSDDNVLEEESGEVELVLDRGDFEEDEVGEYTCTARNIRGSGSVTVYVYAPISLERKPVVEHLEDNLVRVSWDPPTPPPNVPIYQYVVKISSQGGSVIFSHRTSSTNYTFSTELLSAGTYDVGVAVVLGAEGAQEGTTLVAEDQISVTEQESSSISLVVIVAAVVGGVVILVLTGVFIALFFLCYYYPHKRKLSTQQQSWSKEERLDETDQTLGNSYEPLTLNLPPHSELPPSPTSPNNLMTNYFNMDIDPKWEFPRENLQLSEVLCESQYSILYKGSAKGIRDKPLEVAIKALRDGATEEDVKILFYEMDQLANIGPHPNIVSLLRCCTVGKPLYMVMEYMCHGDLLGFLRASRGHYSMYTVSPGFRNQQPPNLQLSSRDLLSIGSKVAYGMRFLADRKIVHRALCCKNILVGSGMDIKVYNIGGYDLPAEVRDPLIKWMAPEVLADNNFSSHSDAWAFGVTLWELVTVGATPYAEINPDDLYSQLYSGMRMPRPLHCAQEVYDIMSACWDSHPASRPHFATIHDRLDNLAHSKMSMLNLRNYNDMEYSQFDEFPSQATAL